MLELRFSIVYEHSSREATLADCPCSSAETHPWTPALLAWIAVPWTFWQAHSVRPRQLVPLDLPIRFVPSVSLGGPIVDLNNETWNELTFLNPATGQKEVVLSGNWEGIRTATLAQDRQTVWTFDEDGSVNFWNTTEAPTLVLSQSAGQRDERATAYDATLILSQSPRSAGRVNRTAGARA